jgi:hypothetical protein
VVTDTEITKFEDWSAPPKELKPQVESLRTVLAQQG